MAVKDVLVMVVVSCFLLLAGCKEDVSPDKNLTQVVYEEEPLVVSAVDDSAGEEQVEEETGPVRPFCGDGNCDRNENCDSCYKDCACKSPAECHKGVCKVPECGGDGDCKDGDPCTKDVCYFAQHPNAYCGHDVIKVCKNKDGCCPKGCNGNTDTDCEAVCGNQVCEPGESSDKCYEDCGPVCGNGKCESGETANSCAADCYKPTCGDRNCETGEDYSNCAYDCCEPDKWYADGETCNCPGGYNRVTDPGFYMCTKS